MLFKFIYIRTIQIRGFAFKTFGLMHTTVFEYTVAVMHFKGALHTTIFFALFFAKLGEKKNKKKKPRNRVFKKKKRKTLSKYQHLPWKYMDYNMFVYCAPYDKLKRTFVYTASKALSNFKT